MSSFMSWLDNDPFAAVVVMLAFVVLTFAFIGAAEWCHKTWHHIKATSTYDGGCVHSPHTCKECR